MSINVNVSGNPVSIKRGKLITADLDYGNDEFQKRRRIRLEQVRQQSKDIAEQVRNKVRDQKSKQLSDIEKQGEKELKKWQTRKLLTLQQQYRECLKDIGLGHAQAVLEEESDLEWERQNDDYKQIAKERGEEAVKKIDDSKRQQNSDKTASLQKKKLNRGIENTRSKMVANLNKKSKSPFKKKKRGKLTTDIDISRRIIKESETDDDSEVEEHLLNISSASSVSSKGEHNSHSKGTGKSVESMTSSVPSKEHIRKESEERSKVPVMVNEHSKIYSSKTEIPEKNYDYYLSTQISDRIKNRAFKHFEPSNSKVCDANVPIQYTCCCCGGQPHQAIPKRNEISTGEETKIDKKSETEFTPVEPESGLAKIPSKPTVALRTVQSTSVSTNTNKVQYCDYKNRCNKEYVPCRSTIERISEESLEVCPSDRSEIQYVERMYKRDQDAQIRGKKALEKEKVRRDYKDMMQQLPALQRQERIASISSNKPTFHMSDDRLKQHEKKYQNRMENAYENLFPKPRIITIPSKDAPKDNSLPFQTISVDGTNPPVLNVGSWDFDVKTKAHPHIDLKHSSSELIQEALNKVLDDSDLDNTVEKRQEQLQEMWKTLTDKREKLAKEINQLPENSKLRSMLMDVGGLDKYLKMENGLKVDKGTETVSEFQSTRRKHRNKVSSSSISPKNTNSPEEEKDNEDFANSKEKKSSRYHCLCTVDTSSSPVEQSKKIKTRSRARYKKTPLILQNTSTQTTPLIERKKTSEPSENIESVSAEPVVSSQGITKSIKPSESNQQIDTEDRHNMCQILIKIDDDGKPQVCVGPSNLKDKEIIVKTGVKRSSPVVEGSSHVKSSNDVGEVVDKVESVVKTQTPKETQQVKPKVKHKHKSSNKPKHDNAKNEDSKNRTSWKEYLSQNSTNTSTSYYSPPDLAKNLMKALKKDSQLSSLQHHLAGILRDKPQQRNVENSTNMSSTTSSNAQNSKDTDLCPLKCIKKLLTMSRQSIEELQISTVSDISTPGSSIIKTKSNTLINKISEYNNDLNDQSEGNNLLYNTEDSTGPSSRDFSSPINDNEQDATNQMTLEEYCAANYPDVMAIYNKLAENCTKKIEYLASLLEKNRMEKLDLISPSSSGSDKETSTKYMELPSEFSKPSTRIADVNNVKNNSHSSTEDQEELNQQLLDIDYSLVERLKSMTPAQIKEQYPLSNLSISESSSEDNIDQALIKRFKNIVESHSSVNNLNLKVVPFPPLLVDLPNLPTLEAKPLGYNFHKPISRSKPPPSKGLTVARRFNNNITSTPHQLSTIVESETIISSRAQRTQTPESLMTQQDSVPKAVELQGPAKAQKVSGESKSTSCSDSLPDIVTELMKDVQKASTQIEKSGFSSDSSASESETIEAMLESLGMGSWALATLRKTQEALAIPSSSSSVDNSSKHKLTDSSSPSSEALVKDFSALKSDESHGSSQFIKELQDISAFDKATRRTSTPVQTSVSDKSKSNCTGELEISVRTSSDKSYKRGMF